jgi:hypothetical protein
VRELHVGAGALLGTWGGASILRALTHLVRRSASRRRVIPWESIDLADPTRPRVRRGHAAPTS